MNNLKPVTYYVIGFASTESTDFKCVNPKMIASAAGFSGVRLPGRNTAKIIFAFRFVGQFSAPLNNIVPSSTQTIRRFERATCHQIYFFLCQCHRLSEWGEVVVVGFELGSARNLGRNWEQSQARAERGGAFVMATPD